MKKLDVTDARINDKQNVFFELDNLIFKFTDIQRIEHKKMFSEDCEDTEDITKAEPNTIIVFNNGSQSEIIDTNKKLYTDLKKLLKATELYVNVDAATS